MGGGGLFGALCGDPFAVLACSGALEVDGGGVDVDGEVLGGAQVDAVGGEGGYVCVAVAEAGLGGGEAGVGGGLGRVGLGFEAGGEANVFTPLEVGGFGEDFCGVVVLVGSDGGRGRMLVLLGW